ncbi:DUF397 domain-containing protein [Streptomyces sp. NBC_00091]|nr:DUF397 domain-containing protein [Streptomyces sp. NBC_00091]
MTWWKSSRGDAAAQCVECGIVDAAEQIAAVRDSKVPTGPAVLLSYAAFGGFVEGVKRGAL